MSVEGVSSLLMTSSDAGLSTVPVEHLDYSYIQQCGNLTYLENILHVLRSGREGVYPHLICFCEKRIEMLDPKHRALRKETHPATAASFTTDEWRHVTDDLQAWQREIKEREQQLMQALTLNTHTLPPVHNRTLERPSNPQTPTTQQNRSAVPREYSDWDRFDADAECAKIDVMNTIDVPAVINNANTHVDTSALTQQEKCLLATREREKGNEAFRGREWEEARVYYTRSLCILPTVAGFNNRAQAEIKLHRWADALRDCDAVLDVETNNRKALMRRATVYTHLGNLQAAHKDITSVLKYEPQNITAQKLLQEVKKKINTELSHSPNSPDESVRGKKLVIQEVNEEEMRGETGDGVCPLSIHPALSHLPSQISDQESARVDKEAQRDTDRQTDGETERQTDGETERQTDGETERQTDGETERQTDGETDGETESQTDGVRQCVSAAAVRSEGNELYRRGQYGDAAEKYTHSITTLAQLGVYRKEDMYFLYCNRAACFLKIGQCSECVSDCCRALKLKPFSVKVLLRRAMAYETLEQFRLAYVDYRTVQQIQNIHTVQQHVNRLTKVLMEEDGSYWKTKLPEVPVVPSSALLDASQTLMSQTTSTVSTLQPLPNTETPPLAQTPLIKQIPPTMEMLLHTRPFQSRRHINIVEVESDVTDNEDDVKDEDGGDDDDDDDMKTTTPDNVFMFGQALHVACCHGDLVACARLLKSVSPHTLPQHISTQLDTHTLSLIIHTLHKHILLTDPSLVYRLLTHLHTIDRFTIVWMLMDSDEKRRITQLFECLCAVECDEFTQENINILANNFI